MRLLPALCALGALGVTAFGDGALSRFSGAVNKKDRGARARTPTARANATEEVRGGGVRATTIKYDKTDHIIDRAIRNQQLGSQFLHSTIGLEHGKT